MKRVMQLLSLPLILALLLSSLGPSLALDRQARLDVMSGVVQISWVKVEGEDVYGVGVGSGTIISPDGLILTNCHVADPLRFGMPPDRVPDFNYLGISLTVRSDRPPQPAYLAEVVAADPYLDLAVIRITRDLDLSPVEPEDLNLPFVERGESAGVEVGDELNIFGYPGIGGETITFTKGVVSGFSLDAALEGRAWIKTDATIAGGNSGGTAVDESGYLVGVPTRAGAGSGDEYVDCRPLADTNGDGRINDSDTCIPVGGFINALRPVRLAEPLIEAARLGVAYEGEPADERRTSAPTGRPRFYNLIFAPGLNQFNQPMAVIQSLPSGSRSLYLFFDYQNMSKGKTLEMKVEIDGREAPDWGLPAGPWGGGKQGMWWVGWDDAPFSDGTWQMVFYVDGEEVAEAEIEIGGRAQNYPSFSNVALSLEEDSRGGPLEPAVLFPAGIKSLYAFFDYENMGNNMDWTRTWMVDGEEGLSTGNRWDSGRSGRYSLELTSQRGLAEGYYRLNLYIEGELVALSNFWVTGEAGGGATLEPIIFAEGVDRRGDPVGIAQSFPSGLEELHAFSDYSGMEDGLDFVIHWYVNGQKVIESPFEWEGGASGTWHDYLYSKSGVLPDAEYGLELEVEGQVLQEAGTTVGTGAAPTPEPTRRPRDGVQVQGTITDLDTGRPIAGAVFLVLRPGITIQSFQWTEDELYTTAEADRRGFYKLPDLLERGQCYSMIIGAEGYWPYGEDDVCVGESAASLIELPIQLEKK
ncbi:MAG: serine protease [Anaerolineae bacterium]